jgi:hypothetical protein
MQLIRTTSKKKFVGFCTGAVKVFVLLGYGALSLGDWCLALQDSIVVSSSNEELCTAFLKTRTKTTTSYWLIKQATQYKSMSFQSKTAYTG